MPYPGAGPTGAAATPIRCTRGRSRVRVEGDAGRQGPVELAVERTVLEPEVRGAEVPSGQSVAKAGREAVPADQRRILPVAAVVLRLLAGRGVSERVRTHAVLVIDD